VFFAYNFCFREDFDDAEIERGFEMAQAIGARYITASSNVTTAKKVDPFAKRYQMRVGMHNHSRIDDNEFATPESFEKARMGTSAYIAVNLDIGHFVAANFEPLEYIRKNYSDILTLHIKDRKKDQGENTVFGEGDTPIVEVLRLVRDERYQFPCNIEYEYRGESDAVTEVKKCVAYCKNALEA
jgi:sugar phosphate isomerase/epimerase